MINQSKSYLYSASGKRYVDEAVKASSITKHYCRSIPIFLCADRQPAPGPNAFEQVIVRKSTDAEKENRFLYKIHSIAAAEETDRTVYLDTDAVCLKQKAESLFDLLAGFDVAVAHAPTRTVGETNREIPACFPEFNTGVIAFRKSDKVRQTFRKWEELYLSGWIKHPHDQGAFRHALYFSELRIATLPPEYNNRRRRKGNCVIWHNRQLFEYFT